MDWKRAMEEERAALMRIVALILALADLAELASARSPAIRGFVLWILRPVEPVLCEFVTSSTDTSPASIARSDVGNELIHLAARFRQLARDVKRRAQSIFSLRDREPGRTEPVPHGDGGMARAIGAIRAFDFAGLSPTPDTS